MTQRHYTLTQTLALVEDLSADQLSRYISAGVVTPVQSEQGPLFRDLDLARLSLVVDLAEGYHLEEEALAMVLILSALAVGLIKGRRPPQEPCATR